MPEFMLAWLGILVMNSFALTLFALEEEVQIVDLPSRDDVLIGDLAGADGCE